MNKDGQLRRSQTKFVFLVLGNSQTGKKTIVRSFCSQCGEYDEEEKSYYTSFTFSLNYSPKDSLDLPIEAEVRVLNSEEIDTDLKQNKGFFEGALGAFIVVSFDDLATFTDGIKWKEKVDLMCSLPNRFPLPIILLINKCDKISKEKRSEWIEKLKIDNYILDNQYFSKFYLINKDQGMDEMPEMQADNEGVVTRDKKKPFMTIVDFVMGFGDIKMLFTENELLRRENLNTLNQKNNKDKGKCVIY